MLYFSKSESMKKSNESGLNTCFYVAASLNCTFDQLKAKLNLQNLNILADGKVLKYEMFYADSEGEACILEFSDNYISLTFFFDKSNQYVYSRNLTVFLSLLVSLKGSYNVNFDDLYVYIIEALSKNWKDISKDQTQVIERLKNQIKILADSNCAISYQLIRSFAENRAISTNLGIFREFSKDVLSRLKDNRKEASNWGILESIGTNPDLIKRAEEALMG